MSGLPRGNGMELFQRRVAVEHAFGRDRDGFVRNASPVSMRDRLDATTPGAAQAGRTASLSQIDTFTLAGGAQTLTLSKLPISGSLNVVMQGIGLEVGSEWTQTGTSLSLLAAADARAGMALQVQYDYLVDLPQPTIDLPDPTMSTTGWSESSSIKVPLAASAQAGDLALVFVSLGPGQSITDLSGYTDRGTATATHVGGGGISLTYTLHVLTKTITGQADSPTVTGAHQAGAVWATIAIPGAAVAASALNSAANVTSADTPPVASGQYTVRCWSIVSAATISGASAGTEITRLEGVDVDILLTEDSTLGTRTASESGQGSWMLATVGVTQ